MGRREATALLVIDMQNDFVKPGQPLATPNATKIIQTINDLAEACRKNKMPVIFTQEMHRPGGEDFGIEDCFEPFHCAEDDPGFELFPEIIRKSNDFVIQSKRRYGSFYNTDLDILLRCQKIENLILTGVCTDICVLTTIIEGRNRDYRCFVVRDAVDGTSQERHDAALVCMSDFFGYVGDSDEIASLFSIR